MPVLALVGYTNAGKSTLLNAMAQSSVGVEDKLFATLDPVTRKITLEGGRQVLATDTVGFINKLPHDLVDAFRSTLEEAVHADILLHVVDVSSKDMLMQYNVAESVLNQLGAGDKPRIIVLNKSDKLGGAQPDIIDEPNKVMVSALNGTGLEDLFIVINSLLKNGYEQLDIVLPYDKSALVSLIYEAGEVKSCEYTERGIELTALMSRENARKIYERVNGNKKT